MNELWKLIAQNLQSLSSFQIILIVLISSFFSAGVFWGVRWHYSDLIKNLYHMLKLKEEEIAHYVEKVTILEQKESVDLVSIKNNFRMAFVNSEKIFIHYKGTEKAVQIYREEKEKTEAKLQIIRDQWARGTIERNFYFSKSEYLQDRLQGLDKKLTNVVREEIVKAIQDIGKELEYDLVTVRNNVVLFSREDTVDDITEKVLTHMNKNLKHRK